MVTKEGIMQKISTFLWFENQAEEAANYYVSIFKSSKVVSLSRYGDAGPGPKGTVMVVKFILDGQDFLALNGGPMFKFTEAVSLVVNCDTQQEIDEMWEKLSVGGQKGQCGWLKDKYGLSWQVVPSIIGQLLKEPAKADRVMQAVMQMTKLDMKKMQDAAA
jgi:predicted 3-demethylubiquinone-9 3-methyltransferase (glyoxalase superfamily)